MVDSDKDRLNVIRSNRFLIIEDYPSSLKFSVTNDNWCPFIKKKIHHILFTWNYLHARHPD